MSEDKSGTKNPEKWYMVEYSGKLYNLLSIPSVESSIAKAHSKDYEQTLKLKDLGKDFSTLGYLLSLAVCGVVGFMELQTEISDCLDNIVKICDESVHFLNESKRSTTHALECMQTAYQLLFDGKEEQAKEYLQELEKIASAMETKAKELCKKFESQSEAVKLVKQKAWKTEDQTGKNIQLAHHQTIHYREEEERASKEAEQQEEYITTAIKNIETSAHNKVELQMKRENVLKEKTEKHEIELTEHNQRKREKVASYNNQNKAIEEKLKADLEVVEKEYMTNCAKIKATMEMQLCKAKEEFDKVTRDSARLLDKNKHLLEKNYNEEMRMNKTTEADAHNEVKQKAIKDIKLLGTGQCIVDDCNKQLEDVENEYQQTLKKNNERLTEKKLGNNEKKVSEVKRIDDEYNETIAKNHSQLTDTIKAECEALSLSLIPSEQTESYILSQKEKKLKEIEEAYNSRLNVISEEFDRAERNRKDALDSKLKLLRSEQDDDDQKLKSILDYPTKDYVSGYNPGVFKKGKNFFFGKSSADEVREQEEETKKAKISAKQEQEALVRVKHKENKENRDRQIADAHQTCNREKTFNENSRSSKIKQADETKSQSKATATSDADIKIRNLPKLSSNKEIATKAKTDADTKALQNKTVSIKKANDDKEQKDKVLERERISEDDKAKEFKTKKEESILSKKKENLALHNKSLHEIQEYRKTEMERLSKEKCDKDKQCTKNYTEKCSKLQQDHENIKTEAQQKKQTATENAMSEHNTSIAKANSSKDTETANKTLAANTELKKIEKEYEIWKIKENKNYKESRLLISTRADREVSGIDAKLKMIIQREKEFTTKEEEYQKQRKQNLETLKVAAAEIKKLSHQTSIDGRAQTCLHASVTSLGHLKMIMSKLAIFWREVSSYCHSLTQMGPAGMIKSDSKEQIKETIKGNAFRNLALQFYGKWVALRGNLIAASDTLSIAQKELHTYSCFHPTKEEAEQWINQTPEKFPLAIEN